MASLNNSKVHGVAIWDKPTEAQQSNVKVASIEEFLEKYKREAVQKRLEILMNCVMKLCEEKLKALGVEANVTGRVKPVESLKKKLYLRHTHKTKGGPYQNREAIVSGRVDFVGLRIALYFPDNGPQVIDMIQKTFEDAQIVRFSDGKLWVPLSQASTEKTFENAQIVKFRDGKLWTPFDQASTEQTREAYQKRFPGYMADHCWARFGDIYATAAKETGWGHPGPEAISGGPEKFEIQIRSVLADAWVTINHGLQYKMRSGQPSTSERQLLDGLKGLVDTGELLLEHLHQIHLLRLQSEDKRTRDPQGVEQVLLDMRGPQDVKQVLLEVLDISSLGPTATVGDTKPLFNLLDLCGVTKQKDFHELLKKKGIGGSIDSLAPSFSSSSISYSVLEELLRELPKDRIVNLWERSLPHRPDVKSAGNLGDFQYEPSSSKNWIHLQNSLYLTLDWVSKASEGASGQPPLRRADLSRCIMLFCLTLTIGLQIEGPDLITRSLESTILAILKPSGNSSEPSEPLVEFALFLFILHLVRAPNHQPEGQSQLQQELVHSVGKWMADIACDRLLWRDGVRRFSEFCEQNWARGNPSNITIYGVETRIWTGNDYRKILDAEVVFWAARQGLDDLVKLQIEEFRGAEARIKWLPQCLEQRKTSDFSKGITKEKLTSMLNSAANKINGEEKNGTRA